MRASPQQLVHNRGVQHQVPQLACGTRRVCARAGHRPFQALSHTENAQTDAGCSRRDALTALSASILPLLLPSDAQAIQGLTAGRIPGLSSTPDENGFFTYTRPEGKSGGHGVGWSEIPRYAFKVPAGWDETPVSIADLGGTEIDLRYVSKDEGSLAVVVAPVLRFTDVGFNADVRIEALGPPDRIIAGFHPELFGVPLDEEDGVIRTDVIKKGDLTYYQWELKGFRLVSATAYKNRLFIMSVVANVRQWKKHYDDLNAIQKSFYVYTA